MMPRPVKSATAPTRQHRQEKFAPLDWLARVASHIPEKGSQMVRYFGTYSNRVRGLWKKAASEQPPETVCRLREFLIYRGTNAASPRCRTS